MAILKVLKKNKIEKEKKIPESKKRDEKPALKETVKTGVLSRYLVKRPWISEKAAYLSPMNQYVFAVDSFANKSIVKKEIEFRYGVKIERVNIIVRKPKNIHWGGKTGQRGGVKKAIVTLKKGHKIEVA